MTTEQTPILTSVDSTLAMFADFVTAKYGSLVNVKRTPDAVHITRKWNTDAEIEIAPSEGLFDVTAWDGKGAERHDNGQHAHELMSSVDWWLK